MEQKEKGRRINIENNDLAGKLIKLASDVFGDCKRSLLDICDIYEERAVSEEEKNAFGKMKKRVHNDVGGALSRMKIDILACLSGVEIPRFGDKNDDNKYK